METHHRRKKSPLQTRSAAAALTRAYRILARRDHGRRELAAKLRRKGFSREAVDQAVARCRELGYLDDARTAAVMASDLVRRGYGPLRIRQTLGQKGLDAEVIAQALSHCSQGDSLIQAARRMLEKKRLRLEREPDTWKRRQMACRYLAGRGFTSEVIDRVVSDDVDWT